jgi:molybdate transport system regulatory protein
MELNAHLILFYAQNKFLDPKRIKLLQGIENTGSITQGAKYAQLSYKAAHDAIQNINQLSPQPCVYSEKGGKGGGGAQLTAQGKRFVQIYDLLETIQTMGLTALGDPNAPLHSLLGVMSQFSLQTSARNQLFGRIANIESNDLHSQITLKINDDFNLKINVTNNSAKRLDLFIGKDAVALIKAPNIKIYRDCPMVNNNSNVFYAQLKHVESQGKQQELNLILHHENLFSSITKSNDIFTLETHYWLEIPSDQIILTCLK